MIKHGSLLAARPIISTAINNGVTIGAKPGTPISLLNASVTTTVIVPRSGEETGPATTLDATEERLYELSTRLDANNNSKHTGDMIEMAKTISNMVAASLNFARNTVNPLVREIVAAAKEEQSRHLVSDLVTTPIVMIELDDVYSDGMLDSILDRSRTVRAGAVPLSASMAEMIFNDLTTDSFLELIKLNSSNFDAKVAKLVSSLGSDVLEIVKSTLISQNGTGLYKFSYQDNSSFLAMLTVLGVKNGNHRGLTNLTPQDHLDLNNALDYFGYRVNLLIEFHNKNVSTNRLISAQDSTGSQICVIGEVYRKWLAEKNGSPEAILGYMANCRNESMISSTMDQLYETPEVFKGVYDRISRTNLSVGRLNGNRATDTCIRTILSRHIQQTYSENPETRRAMVAKLVDAVDRSPYNHTLPLDMHALRIVCATLNETENDAFEILTTMRGYLSDNPTATTEEAALVSASKIVGRWAASQMVIIKK